MLAGKIRPQRRSDRAGSAPRRVRVALQFDDDAKTVAVGSSAGRNAVDLLFAHQFGDALDHGGLVHLEGISVTMIASRSLRMVSIVTLPRITIEPRPRIGRADARRPRMMPPVGNPAPARC